MLERNWWNFENTSVKYWKNFGKKWMKFCGKFGGILRKIWWSFGDNFGGILRKLSWTFEKNLVKFWEQCGNAILATSNNALAQNVSLDIPLLESDHNFGIVHWQVSLSMVASKNTKNVIFPGNGIFCDKRVLLLVAILHPCCIIQKKLNNKYPTCRLNALSSGVWKKSHGKWHA